VTDARSAGAPLRWNVAGLLADEPGGSRTHDVIGVEIPLADDVVLAGPIDGVVRLRRTNRGVLADATLTTAIGAACSRCLRPIDVPLDVRIEEEFLPSLDLATGRPIDTAEEPEVARLDAHHELDLETATREAILLQEPIAPVCRPDCPGLCLVCGESLDGGPHEHPDAEIDPRLEALRSFHAAPGEDG
jgi:uncharacterized protein